MGNIRERDCGRPLRSHTFVVQKAVNGGGNRPYPKPHEHVLRRRHDYRGHLAFREKLGDRIAGSHGSPDVDRGDFGAFLRVSGSTVRMDCDEARPMRPPWDRIAV